MQEQAARSRRGDALTAVAIVAAAVLVLGTSIVFTPRLGLSVFLMASIIVTLIWQRPDNTTLLLLFLALLFVIPGRYVVGPLGAAGTPAALVSVTALGCWLLGRISPRTSLAGGRQPVRVTVLLFAWCMGAGYVASFLRPLTDVEERAGTRSLLALVGWLGVCLLAADGIPSKERLNRLLKLVVAGGTFLALLGILQFTTGFNPFDTLSLPGLRVNADLSLIAERSDLRRVSGTALHAIEYGVVLAMVFPLALHYASHAPDKRHKTVARLQLFLIAVAIPMSISRSAVLGLAVAALVIVPTWTLRRQLNAAVVGAVFLVAFRSVIPGLLGTLKSLFLSADVDPSISGRTDDYTAIGTFVSQRPIFGRGFGTFIPEQYFFLDNEYLKTLVETGYVGLGSLVLVFVVGMSVARGARRRSTDDAGRDLGQSLAASIAVAAATFATFDGLSFRMATGLLFLLVGVSGALWRLSLQREAAVSSSFDTKLTSPFLMPRPGFANRSGKMAH